MATRTKSETINWSPWKHPKAKRWFEELLEVAHLPLMMEHAVDKADDSLGEGETRLVVALALMLGREGIWPAQRDTVLRTIVRKGNVVASRETGSKAGAISLAEHKSHAKRRAELVHEVELLRRRIGLSNRKNLLDPPVWGKFLDMNLKGPWDDPEAARWISESDSMQQICRLTEGTLRLEVDSRPHEIRAASWMVIMLARKNLWPTTFQENEADELSRLVILATRQLTAVKHLFEKNTKANSKQLNDPSYKRFIVSLNQEIHILESRMSETPSKRADEPPCTWGTFW